jgi:dihydroflavonol-4-reductase
MRILDSLTTGSRNMARSFYYNSASADDDSVPQWTRRNDMSKTAFVTGGTGFLGLNLVERLVQDRWRVIALHRADSNLKHLKRLQVELACGDIVDSRSLLESMPHGVDAVFHAAGDTSLWSRGDAQQDRVNVGGTRNVVEAALARKAGRLVHTSSISAYGTFRGRVDENSPQLGGQSWINYQRSKFAAEEIVRGAVTRGLDAVILNPAGIVGHGDVNGWARIIRLACAGKLPGVPPGVGSFCHSVEVANAHIAAAEGGTVGGNYLLGGTDATYVELAAIVGEIAGCEVPSRPTPAVVLRALGLLGAWASYFTAKAPTLTPESAYMVSIRRTCDSAKAMRELGYRAVDLKTMVADSYVWLKHEGLLAI